MLMMAEDEAIYGMRTLLKLHSGLMLKNTYKTSNNSSCVESLSPYPGNTGGKARDGQKQYRTEAAPSYNGHGVQTGGHRG